MKDHTIKGYLLGLIVACPAGKPLTDCPFNKMRTWSRLEQLDYIIDLPPKEAVRLGKQHRECLAERKDNSIV